MISVAILNQNNAKVLHRALQSVTKFERVIVIDGGSSDSSKEICKQFKNVEFIYNKFIGFSEQRNFALSLVNKGWILFLDSDEEVDSKLADYLFLLIKKKPKSNMFKICRTEYLNNQEIKHGIGKSGYQTRLLKET